jgi:hypothetical protein
MRAIPIVASITLLCSLGTAVAEEWLEYRPAGAGYTVEMPGRPALSTNDQATDAGPITVTSAVVERGDVAFIVTHSDFPASKIESAGAERILDGYRGGVVKGRTLRMERHIKVSGYPARSLVLDDPEGRVLSVTVVLTRDRMFQAIYVGAPNDPGAELDLDAVRFLESFALTER